MEIMILILFLVVLVPVGVMIAGIVLLCSTNEATRKRGRNFLLWGFIMVLVEILLGYSICSNATAHPLFFDIKNP